MPSSHESTPVLAVLLAVGALGSCQSYNDKIARPLSQFEAGNFAAAQASFANKKTTDSAFLSGAESGMSALVGGDFELARDQFHAALDAVEEVEERAAIGVQSLGELITEWTINPGTATYSGEGYERVMVHACLGLAYLALGRSDSVLVEARRVDELLVKEEELYEKKYGAGGLGHFLSAMAYELTGKPGEAYIDYKRLEEKGLGGELVQRALVRLSGELRRSEHDGFVERYGAGPEIPPNAASVTLVAGAGMGPAKAETRIDVPVQGGVFSWAVPRFVEGSGSAPLELHFPDSDTTLRASLLEDVSRVAKENLDDRLNFLRAQSAVRGLMKRQLIEQMADNKRGALLAGAAAAFTMLTERADLRAWRTLPESWQAARAFVAPDTPQRIVVAVGGGEAVDLGVYRLNPGEPMFVLARSIHGRLYAHAIGGERVDVVAPEPSAAEAATTP